MSKTPVWDALLADVRREIAETPPPFVDERGWVHVCSNHGSDPKVWAEERAMHDALMAELHSVFPRSKF